MVTNRFFFGAAALIGSLTFAATASAITLTVDTKLAEATVANNAAAEEAWVESVVGMDVTYSKPLGVPLQIDEAGNYFLDVTPSTPGYFVLKFGVGNTNANDHYLFQNIAELTKLVWTDALVNGLMASSSDCFIEDADKDCAGRLSHYGITGDVPEKDVPEPGTLALLGLGLVGLGLGRRRVASSS